MDKFRNFLKKHREILAYMFFGVMTTVVNYAVYIPAYNLAHLPAVFSNMLAWLASVIFAFLTNKPFVFHSHNWSAKVVLPELGKFMSCRLSTGLLETGIIFLSVDILHGNGNLWKLLTSVVVVIVNYVVSKLLVFKKK